MKTRTFKIPSREEFHREFSGVIYDQDFTTNYPRNAGWNSEKIISSVRFRRGVIHKAAMTRRYNNGKRLCE